MTDVIDGLVGLSGFNVQQQVLVTRRLAAKHLFFFFGVVAAKHFSQNPRRGWVVKKVDGQFFAHLHSTKCWGPKLSPTSPIPNHSETMSLSKPPLDAIEALTPSQVDFLKALPKAELHAHLNGSIPLPVLQQLAKEYVPSGTDSDADLSVIQSGIEELRDGVEFDDILDFFKLFPAIYSLISTKEALARVTDAVLAEFLEPKDGEEYPQATYLELRSTPKKTTAMTISEYLETVLDEVEKYRPDQAVLIVSLDRRMPKEVADECIEAAITLKKRGRRVAGVDLCGDPTVRSS
jgi:hypothetical protein